MIVKVACGAGHRAEETPRRLAFDGREADLVETLDCWLGTGHRYFKMADADGAIYILRHDIAQDLWELTMYAAAARRG